MIGIVVIVVFVLLNARSYRQPAGELISPVSERVTTVLIYPSSTGLQLT